MKNSALIFLLILFSLSAFAQKPKPAKNVSKTKLTKSASEIPLGENAEFAKAVVQTNAAERVTALQKFVADFPESSEKIHAQELIVSGRAELADEKLRSNDVRNGVELFKLAVKGIPTPVSDKLFTDIVLQIPTNLFFRGQREAAVDAARLIEEKIDGNAKQLLGLATFYIGTENAVEAKRLAEKAIALEPDFPAAYQTLGLANRLNFQLDDALNAYAKALELDARSTVSKRSLAEMKRAVGKPSEAVNLYREILAADAADDAAETGLILALFDADRKLEAEAELTKALAQNPRNLFLLVGAAYRYAAQGNGAKAVEFGQKAVAAEPRYTWAHIALAQGLAEQNRLLEAERELLTAQQYGNFPTLDYELASVRMAAGFYREAAENLKKTFTVKDNLVETKLGGRVPTQAENFIELLAAERRASIFEPATADTAENAEKMQALLNFSQTLDQSNLDEPKIRAAANNFVKGADAMKLHRQIYAAGRLLEKRINAPQALELAQAAVGGVDAALNVATPAAAVLADELYDSRALAASRNEIVVVPDVPRQTLSKILRGRIEELTGWALYQQQKPDEAVTRFKRALSVLPEKSVWWRDAMWRLGTAFQQQGKSDEALDAYFRSYTSGTPELAKRIVIEVLYQKTNGNLNGLDEKIGVRPESAIAALPVAAETTAQNTETQPIESLSAVAPGTQQPEISAMPEVEAAKSATSSMPKISESVSPKVEVPAFLTDQKPETAAKIEKSPEVIVKAAPLPETNPKTIAENSPIPESKPAAKPRKQSVKIIDDKAAAAANSPAQNSAFETVVIRVPQVEAAKKPEKVQPPAVDKPNSETSDKNTANEIAPTEIAPNDSTASIIKRNSSAERPRIVREKNTADTAPCKIITSQETVSILNDGGSLGILVGFENGGDVGKIKGATSNPADIEITFEPEIGALSGRAFFIVKSVSRNKGTFTITFEAPCGRKEISVKVR